MCLVNNFKVDNGDCMFECLKNKYMCNENRLNYYFLGHAISFSDLLYLVPSN